MERFHDNFRFNPRHYEDYLSVFGRRVLNILIQKWRSDQNRPQKSQNAYQHLRNSTQIKRGSADNRTIRPPAMIFHEINTENDFQDDVQHSDITMDQHLCNNNNIPTTSEMIQTLDTPSQSSKIVTSDKLCISEDINVSSHDLINPVIEGHILNDTNQGMPNMNRLSHTLESSDREKTDLDNGVDWDNMFDTELFSAEAAIANAQLVLEQTKTPVENTFNIQFPREAKKTSVTKIKRNCGKSKEKDSKDIKKSKRKNQPITDAIPKKVKKVSDEPKISFRKQKYTKTVNNWLDDVNPNNSVKRNEEPDQNETRAQPDIIIEKTKEKSNKKVIQAQLANRDGIMKFKKPRTETTKKLESDNNTDESTIPDDIKVDKILKTPEKNKADKVNKDKTPKENKVEKTVKKKPKFMVPIKSQVLVKDVAYRIKILEGNDMDDRDHVNTLSPIENQELVIVLIYSNGFCQLNKHHTEDTHEPEGFLISVDDDFHYFKGDHQKYKEILQSLMEKNTIVCYEGKHLLKYLKSKLDLDIYKINVIDAEIGGSILDPDNPPQNFSELQKLLSFTPQFTIATECVLQKTAWYSTLLKECTSKLVTLLVDEQLWNVFTNIEMKLLPIIAEMERRGVNVDLQKLKSMEDILLKKMKLTELECHKAAGKTFQINSPVQVRALIYDELKLDAKCNMKIRETLAQGAKSTSESMLRGLVSVHPLPRLILEYRHLHKAHATFLSGIAQHVKDGIVRPTWVQTAAATGRIASNNPNLQAIPKAPFSLVLFPTSSETNATATTEETLSFRSVYTSASGHSLLACDFKHVECRVFAQHAGDAALRAALQAGGDLFQTLAHKWLKKPLHEVSAADRERTKRVVYASLYGAGARKLADMLALGYEQALAVHSSFNRTFPSLKSFGESVVSRCAASGGRLSTPCGRVRRVRNIASADVALRAQAERQAVNFIIQGSAADVCKRAMVSARAQLRAAPLPARLLLQIHDELVWEVRDEHLDAAAVIIKRAMESCGLQSGMEDVLPVAVSVGKNWGEMKEYQTNLESPVPLHIDKNIKNA